MSNDVSKYDRRQILKRVLIGGVVATVVLPGKWTKPLVNSIIVPAHAQASGSGSISSP